MGALFTFLAGLMRVLGPVFEQHARERNENLEQQWARDWQDAADSRDPVRQYAFFRRLLNDAGEPTGAVPPEHERDTIQIPDGLLNGLVRAAIGRIILRRYADTLLSK